MTVCPAPCAVDDDYLGLIDDGHPACSGSAATDDELFRADCDSSPGALSARFGEVEKMLLGTYQIMFRYLLFSWFVIPGTKLWNPSAGQLGEPNRRGSKSMPGFVFFFLSSKTSILLCQTSSSRTLHVVPGIRLSGLTWTCSKGTRLLEWRLGDETDCKEVSSLPRQHHPQYNQHVSVLGYPLFCQPGQRRRYWSAFIINLVFLSSPGRFVLSKGSPRQHLCRKITKCLARILDWRPPRSFVRSAWSRNRKEEKTLHKPKKNLYWSNHHCTRNVMFLARPKPSNLVVLVFLSVFVWVSQEKCGDIARAIKADKMPQKKSSTPPLLWVSLLLLRWKRDDPFSFEKRYKYWKSRSPSPLCSYKRNL